MKKSLSLIAGVSLVLSLLFIKYAVGTVIIEDHETGAFAFLFVIYLPAFVTLITYALLFGVLKSIKWPYPSLVAVIFCFLCVVIPPILVVTTFSNQVQQWQSTQVTTAELDVQVTNYSGEYFVSREEDQGDGYVRQEYSYRYELALHNNSPQSGGKYLMSVYGITADGEEVIIETKDIELTQGIMQFSGEEAEASSIFNRNDPNDPAVAGLKFDPPQFTHLKVWLSKSGSRVEKTILYPLIQGQ